MRANEWQLSFDEAMAEEARKNGRNWHVKRKGKHAKSFTGIEFVGSSSDGRVYGSKNEKRSKPGQCNDFNSGGGI